MNMAKTSGIDRNALVRRAAIIALAGNLVLAIIKIVTGIVAGSLAVLGDGIDSSTDVAIAIMTLSVGFIINQPSDKEHPWGHHRAETIGTVLLAFIIMFAGFQLFESAFRQLREGTVGETPGLIALVVTAISIAGKLFLAFTQYQLGKKSGSAMILANAKNMTNDIIISGSVFVGLGASHLFNMPALDAVTALLVSLWVMKSAVGIFREQNLELMDGNADDDQYRALFDAVRSVKGAGNPHRARIRKMASSWDIDLDIEVAGNLTVREAHEIAEHVEEAIRQSIPDVYDIMVHVEPEGNGEHTEQFGLSAKDIPAETVHKSV
jgi:cation diffusion facilitator family transporter